MMHGTYFPRIVGAGVLALVLLSAGCGTFHTGSLMHPDVETIALGEVHNDTELHGFNGVLRNCLSAELMRDGSARLVDPGTADALMQVRLADVRVSAASTAKVRSEDASVNDSHSYQVDTYRASVTLQVSLVAPGKATPLVEWRRVKGTAEFARTAEMVDARRDGIEQAMVNACRQAVLEIGESW